MIDATRLLSRFAYGLWYADLPREAVEATKMALADYLAACFAGYRANAEFNRNMEKLCFSEGGSREAHVLFAQQKLPAGSAAFLNSLYAHGSGLDGGNCRARGCANASVFSSVFALAELRRATPAEIITALNVGFEVFNRLAAAAQPGLSQRGFDATGAVGSIACAAACAKLAELSEDGIYHAISLAAMQSSGLLMPVESHQECGALNAANAAKTGLLSARMAASGICGPDSPLESNLGWFHAMAGKWNEGALSEGLGQAFTICSSYISQYPAVRAAHGVIDAALDLHDTQMVSGEPVPVSDIEHVHIRACPTAIRTAGKIRIPRADAETRYSLCFAFARMFLTGHFDLNDLQVSTISQEERELIGKIELTGDSILESRGNCLHGAQISLVLKDGSTLNSKIDAPFGEGENKFTWSDMLEKMYLCMDGFYTRTDINRIAARVRGFDQTKHFSSVAMFV